MLGQAANGSLNNVQISLGDTNKTAGEQMSGFHTYELHNNGSVGAVSNATLANPYFVTNTDSKASVWGPAAAPARSPLPANHASAAAPSASALAARAGSLPQRFGSAETSGAGLAPSAITSSGSGQSPTSAAVGQTAVAGLAPAAEASADSSQPKTVTAAGQVSAGSGQQAMAAAVGQAASGQDSGEILPSPAAALSVATAQPLGGAARGQTLSQDSRNAVPDVQARDAGIGSAGGASENAGSVLTAASGGSSLPPPASTRGAGVSVDSAASAAGRRKLRGWPRRSPRRMML